MALRPAPQAKKVLIAGGGIAGIEAADALYKRGHHPILCEAGDTLGGQFVLAGAAAPERQISNWRRTWRQKTSVTWAWRSDQHAGDTRTLAAEKPTPSSLPPAPAIIPNIPGSDSGCVVELS